jgi:hypothetical protein
MTLATGCSKFRSDISASPRVSIRSATSSWRTPPQTFRSVVTGVDL